LNFASFATGDFMALFLIPALVLFGLVVLNIWYYRHRPKLSHEERRKLDEDLRLPADW
jgi:hypothetical protein